jgi:PEGA domain-containing protein
MRFAILVAAALAAGGCGTVLKSQQSTIMVNSQTPGAQVLVDGMPMGVTPAMVPVSTTKDHIITVRGAQNEMSCRLESHASGGWIVLDVLLTPAWIVDAITSGWSTLDRTDCMVPI